MIPVQISHKGYTKIMGKCVILEIFLSFEADNDEIRIQKIFVSQVNFMNCFHELPFVVFIRCIPLLEIYIF